MIAWSFEKTGLVCGADVRTWPVTAKITQIDLSGGVWCPRQVREHFWPALTGPGGYTDATLWLLIQAVEGWVMWPADYFRSGQQCRPFPGASIEDAKIGAMGRLLSPVVEAWTPKAGDLVGILVTTPAMGEFTPAPAVNERTGVVFVQWPASFDGPSIPIVAREEDLAPPAAEDPELTATVQRLEDFAGPEDPEADLEAFQHQIDDLTARLAHQEGFSQGLQDRVARQERQLAAAVAAWTKAGA